ncbi:MAG: hypothetical protein VKK62_08935 [Synechococcaceae cyanobacterium]|nr:hypothetical protein [Synechococcaceae cyanobacterium]
MILDEKSLALLYESPDQCPGNYRIVHKLPALPQGLPSTARIDNIVVDALVNHDDFVADIGRLTAEALVQIYGESALFSETSVRALSGQISASLAVALLRSKVLESSISQALGGLTCYDQAAIACPE